MIEGKLYAVVDLNPTIKRSGTQGLELVPRTTMSVTPQDAPLLQGFPRVPKIWFRIRLRTSVSGEYVNTDRPTPAEVDLKSDQRWLPIPITDGYWSPFVGNAEISAPALATPVLEELEYLSGKELIVRSAFRMADGNYFLSPVPDSYLSLTLSMVVMLNPGDDYPILDQLDDPADERLALWSTDKIDYHWGNTGGSVDPIAAFAKARPMAITLVIDPPEVTTYVSYSPRHHFSSTKVSTTGITGHALEYVIGASYLDGSADFWLLELNRWNQALEDVVELHNTYFAIYGMHSDWT